MHKHNQPVNLAKSSPHRRLSFLFFSATKCTRTTQRSETRSSSSFSSSLSPASTMGSLFEILQKKRFLPTMPYQDDLPTFQAQKDTHLIGLRKRISSYSVKIQPLSTASSDWVFRKSKSMSSIGEFAGGPLRRWWDRWWGWVLSRKPAFAQDIEMNEEETALLGCRSKGSWQHIFYKLRSEARKLVRSNTTLPTTQGFRYDSFSYAQNFDDGKREEQ
ncbi:unnamed protein product [Musa acuminata var. zebrina]